MKRRFAVATLLVGLSLAARAQHASFVVRTTTGQLRGIPRDRGGAQFLGVPYGQPPVGPLRWHEPLPAKSWSGIRSAAAFGAPCAQSVSGDWNHRDAETGSEDCLFLNVFTPQWPTQKPLPVIFWIHGGSNTGGSSIGDLFANGTLPGHGVVLVSVEYRLGIFGFFAHPALTREAAHHESGNYGLMDQILALRWVIANIAKFGGDPRNITVAGQSAGAEDTGLLMTSSAKGLFQKAIAESGTPMLVVIPPLAQAEQSGAAFAASALKVPSSGDVLAFLRAIPAQDLLSAVAAQKGDNRSPIGPIIDGWVLPRDPASVYAAGQQAAIPLITGSNAIESGNNQPPDQLRAAILKADGDLAPQALALYGLANNAPGTSDPLYGSAADQWSADTRFRCPAVAQSAWHTAAHHPAYLYQFDRAIPGHEALGARHSGELPYVFGSWPKSGNISGSFGPADLKLADLMETYWANFARTGNPNAPGLPVWPQADAQGAYIEFLPDATAAPAKTPQRAAFCGLYRKVLAQRLKTPQ